MALFKRLSDSFWSYVSPTKSNATMKTPQTAPQFKKPAIPNRKGSLKEVVRYARSMSPTARVDSWRVRSPSQATSSITGGSRKRKQPHTPSAGAGRNRKTRKMANEEIDYTPELDYEGDTLMDDEQDEETNELASGVSNVRMRSNSPASSKGYYYASEDDEQDTTLVVSEKEYNRDSPKRRKVIHIPEEQSSRGVSTEDLRAAGWGDEHIALVQRIAMRGFEPLLPRYYKMDYKYLPDELFAQEDDAFISSVRGEHYRGILALQKLFELGGRTRDRILLDGKVTPEQQVRLNLKDFLKWAAADSGLDLHTTIPILALENKPADVPAPELQENARRNMARLHARYEEAFRVQHSIESTPTSNSTRLSHPIPQLYAIIASYTVIALVAYRPDLVGDGQVKTVAFFDMQDKDYDVWNALALAIIVCHARNVQVRLAQETGLGVKDPMGEVVQEEDDPDL